jgi:tight adherence protein C
VIAAVLAFAAAVLAVLGLFSLAPVRIPARRWGRRRGDRAARVPVALRLLAGMGRAAVRQGAPREVERRIVAAGRPAGVGSSEVMAAKVGGAVAVGLCSVSLGAMAPGRLGLFMIVAGPVAGFLLPDLWLSRRAAERARAARRQLPGMLDLLRVTVEAGSSLARALATVSGRSRGPLAAEWSATGHEAALGVPLEDALAGMAERLPLPEVRALATALERTRRHGVPLGSTLAAQARDARLALRRHVQEEAARAAPKIQLVVALLLVPSVLLLVAAALLSALLGSPQGGIGEL